MESPRQLTPFVILEILLALLDVVIRIYVILEDQQELLWNIAQIFFLKFCLNVVEEIPDEVRTLENESEIFGVDGLGPVLADLFVLLVSFSVFLDKRVFEEVKRNVVVLGCFLEVEIEEVVFAWSFGLVGIALEETLFETLYSLLVNELPPKVNHLSN